MTMPLSPQGNHKDDRDLLNHSSWPGLEESERSRSPKNQKVIVKTTSKQDENRMLGGGFQPSVTQNMVAIKSDHQTELINDYSQRNDLRSVAMSKEEDKLIGHQIDVGVASDKSQVVSQIPIGLTKAGVGFEHQFQLSLDSVSATHDGGSKANQSEARISYSDVVNSGVLASNPSLKTELVNGESIGIVPVTIIEEVKPLWTDLLVGRFASKAPNAGRVHVIVNKIWPLGNKNIKIEAHEVNETTIKFRISDARTRERILRRGMWNIAGVPMVLSRWAPAEELDDTAVKIMPIWVTLKNVPRLLFHWPGLRYLARAVGEPKKLHPETLFCSKFDEAKILVDVNLTGSMPKTHKFRLPQGQEFTITYHYPWVPRQCVNCQKWGHLKDACEVVQGNVADGMKSQIDIGVKTVTGIASNKDVSELKLEKAKQTDIIDIEAEIGKGMISEEAKDTMADESQDIGVKAVIETVGNNEISELKFENAKQTVVADIEADIGKGMISEEAKDTVAGESNDPQVNFATKKEANQVSLKPDTNIVKESNMKDTKAEHSSSEKIDGGIAISVNTIDERPNGEMASSVEKDAMNVEQMDKAMGQKDRVQKQAENMTILKDSQVSTPTKNRDEQGISENLVKMVSGSARLSPIEKMQLEIRSSLLTHSTWADQLEDYQDENEEVQAANSQCESDHSIATTRCLRTRQSKKDQNKKKQNSNQKSQRKNKQNSDHKGNGKKGRRGYK